MNQFAGIRAEREWLSVLKRIAAALERIADELEADDHEEPMVADEGETDDG